MSVNTQLPTACLEALPQQQLQPLEWGPGGVARGPGISQQPALERGLGWPGQAAEVPARPCCAARGAEEPPGAVREAGAGHAANTPQRAGPERGIGTRGAQWAQSLWEKVLGHVQWAPWSRARVT